PVHSGLSLLYGFIMAKSVQIKGALSSPDARAKKVRLRINLPPAKIRVCAIMKAIWTWMAFFPNKVNL
ncbi:MAG TPA: hypothetical protein VN369_00485, partial [Terriglobales bacterium]|nr:hypothetical protein [Terriglobales bacterium]